MHEILMYSYWYLFLRSTKDLNNFSKLGTCVKIYKYYTKSDIPSVTKYSVNCKVFSQLVYDIIR